MIRLESSQRKNKQLHRDKSHMLKNLTILNDHLIHKNVQINK